ncbi:ATP synthase gamma chain [Mesoplasma sp. JKS002658]|uniref:ATP synthase F1 subunit gamma n=1 Tax=Mesoplasma whartonense TaxID=2878854 RepID=UPI002022AD88|nr:MULTISPECIES: ATP synthase F1 subunit gamma [unclassified Mesoplasma]MCL8211724.1 ATP synthase gamma chain [Mesoplasma sp. JKS002664]MCL8212101.1 ATP synthase gamma chain [Mesoplasma sp. JKS002662]MCL8212724.1 ATP synthase gamma chain [Mesoplasma sp. JKS002661]MCL8213662.1 ATP synthase gamma chain [Mesoplasma sp. JKS002660]MCL8213794.1 ATP synthase gamma chain [Mesoplasma sp. JKS002658]
MPNLSGLKAEIISVGEITNITDAMQLVASAKLRRAGKKITETQQYVSEVYSVFNEIIQQTDDSPFLKPDETTFKKTLWVVVNSNLGLCGGYNTNINKEVMHQIKPDDEIYALGSKAVAFYSARKIKIIKSRVDIDVNFSSSIAGEIGQELMGYYTSHQFDEIKLAYTKFINNVTFTPTTLRLFPIVKNKVVDKAINATNLQVEFEPDAQTILEKTINLYLNTVLYGTIAESQVSEQASRRTAMDAATKNGKEMVEKLNIKYNRERQAAITQEISEIVGGANALAEN